MYRLQQLGLVGVAFMKAMLEGTKLAAIGQELNNVVIQESL